MRTCTPWTVTTIQQVYTDASSGSRIDDFLNPNVVSGAPLVANGATGATGYGDLPRNAFRGPMQQNWDFSLMKRFTVKESHQFSARMDVFNVWNHPIFRFPSTVQLATP